MVSFTKGKMYEKIKSDSRHFLWVFLLAVDPQITIYMEECHAAARLRERSGKSNDRVHSGFQCPRHNGRAGVRQQLKRERQLCWGTKRYSSQASR